MFDDTRGGDGGDGGDGWGFFDSSNGRPMHYILDGRTPKPVPMMVWARWFENAENRRVAVTRFRGLFISTVFIGFDAAFNGPPRLFETGLFIGGKNARMADCWRSSTWDEAMAFHGGTCAVARVARSGRARARQDHDTRAGMRAAFRYRRED